MGSKHEAAAGVAAAGGEPDEPPPTSAGAVAAAAADAAPSPPQQPPQQQPSSSSASEQAEQQPFVNEGLQTWLERRRQWTQKPPDFKRTARKRAYSPAVTPEQVLSFTPFPKPVALQDVIEVLQDVWEEDYF